MHHQKVGQPKCPACYSKARSKTGIPQRPWRPIVRHFEPTPILTIYRNGEETDAFKTASSSFNSSFSNQLEAAGGLPKTGQVRNFFGVSEKYPIVTLTSHCDKDNSSSEGQGSTDQILSEDHVRPCNP